jgi:hypothetical protein
MSSRLEVQNEQLARAFGTSEPQRQAEVTEHLVAAAVAEQQPPLAVPEDPSAHEALLAELDYSDDMDQWRRARALNATLYFRRAQHAEALYEALHAHRDVLAAESWALEALS